MNYFPKRFSQFHAELEEKYELLFQSEPGRQKRELKQTQQEIISSQQLFQDIQVIYFSPLYILVRFQDM